MGHVEEYGTVFRKKNNKERNFIAINYLATINSNSANLVLSYAICLNPLRMSDMKYLKSLILIVTSVLNNEPD